MLSSIKSPVLPIALNTSSPSAPPAHAEPAAIQEVPITPVSEHPSSRHTTQSLDAARTRGLLLIPEYVRGKMPRLRMGVSRQWYEIKDDLKRTFIRVQWNQFLEGKNPTSESTVNELREALNSTLQDKHIQSERVLGDARRYIDEKVNNLQFRHYTRDKTNLFLTKGTNLVSEVFRTEHGNFYRILPKMDRALKEKIEAQQNVPYNAIAKLKKGATGKLRLAEQLNSEGSTVVVAKTNRKGRDMYTAGLTTEANRYASLPTTRHFSSVRDVAYVEDHKDQARFYLFMDLQIRGDIVGVLQGLGRRQDLDAAAKQQILRTFAYQMIEAVNEMHQVGLAHQDIKPDNFLFSKDGAIVLTDFGTATGVGELAMGHTDGYIPPEHGVPGTTSRNGDKYSLGRTLGRICGAFPDLDASYKNELYEIAHELTANDPDNRPDLSEILGRPCFNREKYTDDALVNLVDRSQGKSRNAE
jgi:thiamine kinase-like enzyme